MHLKMLSIKTFSNKRGEKDMGQKFMIETESVINRKLLHKITDVGLRTMKMLDIISCWKEDYKFSEIKDGENKGKVWIENRKGLLFDTLKDAEEYAYVDWCNNHSLTL